MDELEPVLTSAVFSSRFLFLSPCSLSPPASLLPYRYFQPMLWLHFCSRWDEFLFSASTCNLNYVLARSRCKDQGDNIVSTHGIWMEITVKLWFCKFSHLEVLQGLSIQKNNTVFFFFILLFAYHSSLIYLHRSVRFHVTEQHGGLEFTSLQRFSLGFRPRDWLGCSRTLIFLIWSHSLVCLVANTALLSVFFHGSRNLWRNNHFGKLTCINRA